MIIQSKGPGEQPSLGDLLTGEAKAGESKANGMFSKLLAALGATAHGEEKKTLLTSETDPFKAVIDPKSTSLKQTVVKSGTAGELKMLLGGTENENDLAFISRELLDTLNNDQVRNLIHRAKEYLKNEISTKVDGLGSDSKSFPKSLMGLIHLADKLGLEPQSITLSNLVTKNGDESPLSRELLTQPLLDAKALTQISAPAQEEHTAEAITQLLSEIKTKGQKNLPESVESASNVKESQPLQALLRQNLSAKGESEAPVPEKTEIPLSKNATPVFGQLPKTDNQSPAAKNEEKKGGEEKSSVAPSMQPTTKTEGLMALLHGDSEPSEGSGESRSGSASEAEPSKALHASKPDSLEVKTKEAQQSMRHFASDLKEAVENYKPPFTRLTMKLNPEKLGEVEVTLVQRGNNVHVNIQSNNAASVAFLAHNATELKAQLAHQGITNATMNFMGGGENQHSQGQQQQSHNPFRTYQSLAELELNEEQLGALELIIPHYA